jgi:hypothetical protein
MVYMNAHGQPGHPEHEVGDLRGGVPNRAGHSARSDLYYRPFSGEYKHTGFEAGAL